MWSAIAVIALGLFGIVMYSFAEDPNKNYEPKQETKQETKKEKLPVETTQVKDKQHYSNYIDKELSANHYIGDNLDPSVFEYTYNKYFSDLKIDRSIDFGPVRYGSVSVSADLSDKIFIKGSMLSDSMMFTELYLYGFGLKTDKEINEFKEITLAVFTSVANQDVKDSLYKTMNFNEKIKNGGEVELIMGDIKYVLSQSKLDDGSLLITFLVSNIKNP